MPILDKVKPIIDYPRWRQPAPTLNAHAAGSAICFDKRNDNSRHPLLYQLVSAAVLNAYDPRQDGWSFVGNPGLSAFGAGSCAVFCPSQGVRGTLGSGSTSTSIVVGSVLTAVIAGQLTGNRIRMIGNNNAGSCGRIEERMIIGNSAGTSPTIYLDSPLSYSYISGDAFEIHSGRVYMLGTTAGATQLRYYDTIYQTLTSAGNTTLTIAVDSEMVCLDEDYVPYDRKPGEGLVVTSSSPAITYDTGGIVKYCLQASAVGVGTVTGSAAGGDNNILANEYRNFQIRIVEDTTTPTAVGQRATIASHTAGAASPLIVYTLGANWGVRPSNNAKYVIENPNVILLFAQAAGTTIYTYNPTPATINNGTNTITTGAFSTPYFGVVRLLEQELFIFHHGLMSLFSMQTEQNNLVIVSFTLSGEEAALRLICLILPEVRQEPGQMLLHILVSRQHSILLLVGIWLHSIRMECMDIVF